MPASLPPVAGPSLGKPIDRVDGRLKVTGGAKYSGEIEPAGAAQAFLVMSAVSRGRVTAIDTTEAARAPGVLKIYSHLNWPGTAKPKSGNTPLGIRVEKRLPFSDDVVAYGGQYVAVVVADTFERARRAASLVKVSYDAEKPALVKDDIPSDGKRSGANQGKKTQETKGSVDGPLGDANLVRIKQTYLSPVETHNPIEPSATYAEWTAHDRLVVHDATQFLKGTQSILAEAFEIPRKTCACFAPSWVVPSAARDRSGRTR